MIVLGILILLLFFASCCYVMYDCFNQQTKLKAKEGEEEKKIRERRRWRKINLYVVILFGNLDVVDWNDEWMHFVSL